MTKINYDDIIPGSPEWRMLPHAKRREIQRKRLGGHTAKVYTEAEANEAGLSVDWDEYDDSHIRDPNVNTHTKGHRAVVRGLADISEDEARKLGYKAYENWKAAQPDNPREDVLPSDRNVRDPGVIVTQVREHDGYRIERRNPFGHYVIPRLEELGTFVTLEAAEATLRSYLNKQRESDASQS